MSNIKVAVFGGSFNPPHIGHAMVIQWLLWSGTVDKVLIVPSDGHPLKTNNAAPLDVRISLLEALVKDLGTVGNQVEILDVERHLPSPVYSYDLLKHLQEKYPDYDLHFVIGADILHESHRWHKWDKLCKKFSLIVLGRATYESFTTNPTFPDYSSSRIRHLMAIDNSRWGSMLTPGVRNMLLQDMPDYPIGTIGRWVKLSTGGRGWVNASKG